MRTILLGFALVAATPSFSAGAQDDPSACFLSALYANGLNGCDRKSGPGLYGARQPARSGVPQGASEPASDDALTIHRIASHGRIAYQGDAMAISTRGHEKGGSSEAVAGMHIRCIANRT